MATKHNFQHLPLVLSFKGKALLKGGGKESLQTKANKNNRQAHSNNLRTTTQSLSMNWQHIQAQRQAQNLPAITHGIPILLQVDPNLDLDVLRAKFAFEIVAEQEDGYVIVASEDINLTAFLQMVTDFATQVHGSATVAQIHKLFDDPNQNDRLGRILSERLLALWPDINDEEVYIVDVGVTCVGTQEIPPFPTRGKRDSDIDWAIKEREWSLARVRAYEVWDETKLVREDEVGQFIHDYNGEILSNIDGKASDFALPDSFTIRLQIIGKGLRDFILNYPYIFEVVEPEDIKLPQQTPHIGINPQQVATPTEPDANAPAVCVIDSGIQEGHFLLQPAIDQITSHCFLPGVNPTNVGDFVSPSGHGTRVAGAILYGENVAKDGTPQLPFWIQNARVLDENNRMPVNLFPPQVISTVVQRFYNGVRHTRIFNHSINANVGYRLRYMSAWAAEIDLICANQDVLIIQSGGNLCLSGGPPHMNIEDHLTTERDYPKYLYEPFARIANPGQSLQALTVGSVAYGHFETSEWQTFAQERGAPSAFSRAGFGIWNTIKPEVVEYGGDNVHTPGVSPSVQTGSLIPQACPELVRSTMFSPGPAFDRDEVGTSFAAPKVSRLAARLQQLLPDEPALLYRALIVQSARWPTVAEAILTALRSPNPQFNQERKQQLLDQAGQVIRCLGYGIPDEDRATSNTDYRTTLITSAETRISAGHCHIYQIPIPQLLRQQGDDFDIRIDVTLSYVAHPRRTRRNLRRYLSTWVDWKSSKLGEGINNFLARAMKDEQTDTESLSGSTLRWTLHDNSNFGFIRNTKRNNGTVQKDWAIVKSNQLPDDFCIAVIGHRGWSCDPDSTASYALAVTFEILGHEITIYEPLRAAVLELQTQVETRAEVEIEVEI